jgi:hypothetical protein
MPSLLDTLFGKQKLEEVSLDEIYSVIAEFPSFNAAHFLLSKKLKEENDPAYTEETKKTALYFNNPVWLQLLLNERPEPETVYRRKQTMPAAFDEAFQPAEEEILVPVQQYDEPEKPDDTAAEEYQELPAEYKEFPEDYEEEKIPEHIEEPVLESAAEPGHQDKAAEVENADLQPDYGASGQGHAEPVQEQITEEPEYTEPLQDYSATEIPSINHHQPSTINEEYCEPDEQVTINEEYAEVQQSQPIVNQEFTEEPQPVTTVNQEYAMEEAAVPTVNQEFAREKEAGREKDAESSGSPAGTSSPASGPTEAAAAPPPFDAKKADSIVFAPYHMIDYFASQGIRLVLEDQPADNFGKQLKSFTDWLKVMKRLPQKQLFPEKTDEREAERIRHFAANSIEERDILTETMAEVLAKQGMYENAIALYQKLSLIYPPKSGYFASRIEQLKASLS